MRLGAALRARERAEAHDEVRKLAILAPLLRTPHGVGITVVRAQCARRDGLLLEDAGTRRNLRRLFSGVGGARQTRQHRNRADQQHNSRN